MFLARIMRRRSSDSRYLTRPLSLALLVSSRLFRPSRISSLSARRLLAVKNALSPVTAPTILQLARRELRYLSLADVTGSFRPRPSFLTVIVIKFPKMGGRYFYFQKKR